MLHLLLVNEGTTAVGVMAVAMAIAFLMVVALGAYVLYCDAQNRAGGQTLVPAHGEGHPVAPEDPAEPAEPAEPASTKPAARRRTRPPAAH